MSEIIAEQLVNSEQPVKKRGRPKKDKDAVAVLPKPVKEKLKVGRPKKNVEKPPKVPKKLGRPRANNDEAIAKRIEMMVAFQKVLSDLKPTLMEKYQCDENFIDNLFPMSKLNII